MITRSFCKPLSQHQINEYVLVRSIAAWIRHSFEPSKQKAEFRERLLAFFPKMPGHWLDAYTIENNFIMASSPRERCCCHCTCKEGA